MPNGRTTFVMLVAFAVTAIIVVAVIKGRGAEAGDSVAKESTPSAAVSVTVTVDKTPADNDSTLASPSIAVLPSATATAVPVPTVPPEPTNTAVPLPTNTLVPTHTPIPTNTAGPTQTPMPTKTPVPPTATPKPASRSRIGIWLGDADSARLNLVAGAGAKWTRVSLSWSSIEPVRTDPPTYQFGGYDESFARIARAGLEPIVEVRGNPAWAADNHCGAIKGENLNRFAGFMQALVKRYGAPPYNIKHWEFYNEPDNTSLEWGNFLGGCWGNQAKEYAAMLHTAYAAIKQVDPNGKVVFGGLAYESPPAFFNKGFLEQVLAEGGGNYFDIANVHFYSSQSPAWEANGQDIAGKVGALRKVLAKYGLNKPVVVTELSWTSTPKTSPEVEEKQAQYVPKVLARGLAIDLYVMTWFTISDWQGTDYPYGLSDISLKPRLSYSAFKTATAEFGETSSVRRLAAGDVGAQGGFEGYAFNVNGRERWLIWSTGGTAQVTIPGRATELRDKLGKPLPMPGGARSMGLGESPVYVHF